MSAYTVGDTANIVYTFLLNTQPSDNTHCHYSLTDEDGALLAGEQPALIVSKAKLPSGRYRVKVSASIVIPDTTYDSMDVDFFLQDSTTTPVIDESGSSEITVTVDIAEESAVTLALFNQDVVLKTKLAFATASDQTSSDLRLSIPSSYTVLRGDNFTGVTITLSEEYSKDLVLTYSAVQLPPLEGQSVNPAFINSLSGQITIPAFTLSATLTLAGSGILPAGVVDHAMLTFTPPVGSGIPAIRTRLIGRLALPGEDVDKFVSIGVGKLSPGDTSLTLTIIDGGTDTMQPYTLGLQLSGGVSVVGEAGIDFPDTKFRVVVSDEQATVDLPLFYTNYAVGMNFAVLTVNVETQPAIGQQVKVIGGTSLVTLTAPEIVV